MLVRIVDQLGRSYGWEADYILHELPFPLIEALQARIIEHEDADARFQASLADKELGLNPALDKPLAGKTQADSAREVSAHNALMDMMARK